jgi:predicted RNA-binding protein with PUA-like domain
MGCWLLKTEPEEYSFDDLVRDGRGVWDGVKNNQALMFMREMKKGDEVLIYHTGKVKAVVGLAIVVKSAYPDPKLDDEKRVVIDVKARRALPKAVSLKSIKEDERFGEFLLVRNSRLSVMPVAEPLWKSLLKMGGWSHHVGK